ncbi:MAG: AAA family ATPase [Planctomycetes bacterium]|nr:AAA family ATPase [Planctomycetota bacterium]
MLIEKVRVQNFQCICDSGEVPLDPHVTVLVGENESGKSAFLRGLEHFNRGVTFQDVDLCTMSAARAMVAKDPGAKQVVEMVSIWLTLDERDLKTVNLPDDIKLPRSFKVTKMLSGAYVFQTDQGTPLVGAIVPKAADQLVSLLTELRARVSTIYCGQVKRTPGGYGASEFAFLQAQAEELPAQNLYLQESSALAIWGNVRQGVWLQVGNIANDPWGRNRRALNVGLKVDVDTWLGQFLENVVSKPKAAVSSLERFMSSLRDVPKEHPVRMYLTDKVLDEMSAHARAAVSEPVPIMPQIEGAVGPLLPEFTYVPDVGVVSDHVVVTRPDGEQSSESDNLFDELLGLAELKPQTILTKNQAERIQLLREKSVWLSRRLEEYWPQALEADFDFFQQDTKIGVAITAQGSFDPPSRRSHGLRGFVSLYAKLVALSKKGTSLLLLDDPAIHLHPVAQRKLTSLLSAQQFPIILATHLPFLIDPEHLERVRVFVRSDAGSRFVADWDEAQRALLPVWDSFLGNMVAGRLWLLVEGKNDRIYYEAMSGLLKKFSREHLPPDVAVVPAGGDQLVHAAQALADRGVNFLVLLDGDKAGQAQKRRLVAKCRLSDKDVITLSDLGIAKSNPEVEDLFSQQFKTDHDAKTKGLPQVVAELVQKGEQVDAETMGNFERVFTAVAKALA